MMNPEQTLVAIFGNGLFRVRELPPGQTDAITVKTCELYESAEDFVNEHYTPEQMLTPEAFRAEVARRKGGA